MATNDNPGEQAGERMRIAFINPTILIRRPLAELIDQLGDSHELAVLTPKKPFSRVDDSWHSNTALGKARIYAFSAINPPGDSEWPIPVTPMVLVQLLRVLWHYRVVHAWTYFYLHIFMACLLNSVFRHRFVLTADTFPAYSFEPGRAMSAAFRLYTRLFGWLLFGAPHLVHVYGESMIPYAVQAGVRRDKIRAIPTGIHLEKFTARAPKQKGTFTLFYAGLLVGRKGIGLMLDTLRRLADHDVQLVLAGDGPSRSRYEAMAAEYGIRDKVQFLGWRKDVPELLGQADCVFLPSSGEGLPGIVMEAMAAGKAVVASAIPCTSDLVEDGVTGFLCSMDDVECYASGISYLVQHRKRCREMGQAGRERIEQFSWEQLIERYRGLYV